MMTKEKVELLKKQLNNAPVTVSHGVEELLK